MNSDRKQTSRVRLEVNQDRAPSALYTVLAVLLKRLLSGITEGIADYKMLRDCLDTGRKAV